MTAVIESDPPLIVTHVSLHQMPEGHANVYGHVHSNAPLRPGPRINACVEHAGHALDDVLKVAAGLLAEHRYTGLTTADRIIEGQ